MATAAKERPAQEEQLRALNYRCIYFKGQITSMANYLESYVDSKTERIKLREKIGRLRNQFEQFNNYQDQLAMLTNDHKTIEKLREEVANNYDEVIASAIVMQESFDSKPPNSHPSEYSPNATSAPVKLPKIELPKFDGRIENWVTFKDAFQTMIHSRAGLGNVEKLNYLKLSLLGKAEAAISAFTTSEDNYEAAWNHLIEIYDNKRALVLRHATLLRDTPAMPNDSSEAVRDLATHMQLHIRSLHVLGRTWEDIANDLLASIVISRMGNETRRTWENTLSDTEVPKINDIFKFLHISSHQCKDFEDTSHTTTMRATNPQNSHNNGSDQVNYRQTRFNRRSPPSSPTFNRRRIFATATRNARCGLCNAGEHAAFQCKKFLDATAEKRIEAARNAKLCLNCLKPGHSSYECRGGRCKKCNRPHNTRLHLDYKHTQERTAPDTNYTATTSS